jgi:hypothetical protein
MDRGTNVNLIGVGGISNATYILSTATNLKPTVSWVPVWTNQFNALSLREPFEKRRIKPKEAESGRISGDY